MTSLVAALALLLGAPPDDAADLKGLVDRFFTALAAKDGKAILSAWSAESPRLEEFKAELEAAIASPSATPPSEIKLQDLTVEDGAAQGTVRFKGKWCKQDEAWKDEPVTVWKVWFRKEEGKWKWLSLVHIAEILATELVQTPADQRKALLEANRDFATARMVEKMIENIEVAVTSGNADVARGLATGAVLAAEFIGRKDLLGKALLHYGIFLANFGQPGESIPSLKRAKELGVELKDPDLEASAGAHLGFALSDTNRPDLALAELAAARALAAKHDLHEMTFVAILFTSIAHERRGAFEQGLRSAEEALAFAKEKQPGQVANALESKSRLQWRMDRLGEALVTAREGLKLATEPEDYVIRGKLLNNAGMILQASAEYSAAREMLDAAYALYQEWGMARLAGAVKNNIGMCWWEERKLDKAAETYREALDILEKAGDLPMAAVVRNNLGTALRLLGDADGALKMYQASYEYSQTLASPSAQIVPLTNLGELLGAKHEFDEAIKLFEKAVELADKHGTPFDRYAAHLGVGRMCERRRSAADLPRAIDELRKAAALLEAARSGLRDAQLQQGYLSRHAPLYHLLADVCLRGNRRAEAFAACEEAKGRTLVELLGKGSDRISKSMTAEERGVEIQLEEEMSVLTRKLGGTALTDQQEAIEREIARARAGLDELRQGLALRIPDLDTARGRFTPASLETINKTLLAGKEKTALVSYLLGEERFLIFVVLPGETEAVVKWHRMEVPMETLKELLEDFWSKCSDAGADVTGASRKLYSILLKEVASQLAVDHLVIIPDGPLHGIPFHALQDPDGKHVIERWSVSYAPSATALVKMAELAQRRRAKPPAGRTPLVAVGSPTMPAGLGDLPGAKKEAEAVAAAFKVEALVGPKARKSVVKAAMQNTRLVLIATHGHVDEASPLYSHVVLAEEEGNDGRLRAREIADLDLKADVVVLSACDTGRGRHVRGEGVVGLTWALFAGGTPSSVVALWQVADESAGGVIQPFFEGVGTADPRPDGAPSLAKCLQEAQCRMLRDGKHAHPYYWAPFILVGQPR